MRPMDKRQDGQFADSISSAAYRRALNDAFEYDPQIYEEQAELAEDILQAAVERHPNGSIEWEARRGALLFSLYNPEYNLGPFEDYFRHINIGKVNFGEGEVPIDEMGEAGPVQTNTKIVTIRGNTRDPQIFVKAAAELIERQKRLGPRMVGPENYATAVKFFADKFVEQKDSVTLSNDTIDVVQRTYRNFFMSGRKDSVNIVEITNVMSSIAKLPGRIFPKDQIDELNIQILEVMPHFKREILSVMFRALSKIKGGINNPATAEVVSLGLHMQGDLQRSDELVASLDVIGNLGKSDATDDAFRLLMQKRSNLEEATFSYETYEDILTRLEVMVENNLTSQDAISAAMTLGHQLAATAVGKIERDKHLSQGEITPIIADEEIVKRVVQTFLRIKEGSKD